jgi:hypothetical protein
MLGRHKRPTSGGPERLRGRSSFRNELRPLNLLGPEPEKVTDPTVNIAVTDALIVRAGKLPVVRVRLA